MKIIGHRGACGLAPENTMAAFYLAADLGAKFIETDLRLTKDGRIVLIHDGTLRRTTNGRGKVHTHTYDELRHFDAGSRFSRRFAGEPIPSLEELLELSGARGLGLYLEIKSPCRAGLEQALVEAIHRADAKDRCRVIGFDLEVLDRVRRLDSGLALGYLFSRHRRHAIDRALSVGASTILPRQDRVSAKLIAEAKRHQLEVVTWTVDDAKRMRRLIALGVDGIMSNFPGRLASIVSRS